MENNKNHILIVDDDDRIRNLLKDYLNENNYVVSTAEDADQAKERLKYIKFDIIILDVMMPGQNGYELVKEIKNDSCPPIILLTANGEVENRIKGLELGADDYVTKPFDKIILEARISACIEKKHLRDKEKELLEEISKEKDKSDRLLLNILPKDIANRLKSGESVIADKHNEVSILFADIVEFTPQTKNLNPVELVSILNDIFSKFDDLSVKYGIEKIKTIGDNYFSVSGLNQNSKISAKNLVSMAIDMIKTINKINSDLKLMELNIRIGIHSGPVVAGVIGKNKFAYDLWGASVNMASRMESSGFKNKIQISERTYELVKDYYKCEIREGVKIKGIGITNTYIVREQIV